MKKRDANMELMRIILFVMVVTLHVVSPYRQTYFEKFTFSWQFTGALASLARICTNCFVLISGFFYYSNRNKRPLQSIIKLILPLALYLPFYFFLDLNMGFSVGLARVVDGLLSNDYNLYHLWYFQVFIILTLIAPFLTAAIDNTGRAAHKAAITFLLLGSSALPTFTYLTGLEWFDLKLFDANLILFMGLFLLGAYIKKYPPRLSAFKAGVLFFSLQIIIVLGNVLYNSRYSPVNFIRILSGEYTSLADGAWIESQGLSGAFGDPRITVIVAASAAMLIFFSKLEIQNAAITRIARHVYGAYIIHVFWIQVFSRVNINGMYFDLYSKLWPERKDYALYILGFIAAVSIASILTDWALKALYKLLSNFAHRWILGRGGEF